MEERLLRPGRIVLVEYEGRHYECEVIDVIKSGRHWFFVVAEINDYLTGHNLVEVIR